MYVCVCMYVSVYVCMYIFVCIYVCVCMYVFNNELILIKKWLFSNFVPGIRN